jgi:hypothetical protein
MIISRPSSFRRQCTAISLFVWPAAMMLAAVVQPTLGEDPAQVYSAAVAQPGRLAVSAAIGLVGVLAWIIGTAGLVHVVRGRAVGLAHTGGGLSLLAAIAHVMIATLFLVLIGLSSSKDQPATVEAIDHVASQVFPIAMPLLFLGAIGILLLGIAARRDRTAPAAVPILIGCGILVEFVPLPGTLGDLLTWAFVGVGLGIVGTRLLKMSNGRWNSEPSKGAAADTDAEVSPSTTGTRS